MILAAGSLFAKSGCSPSGESSNQDNLIYLKLRRWAKRRTGSAKKGHYLYWRTINGNNWVFAPNQGGNTIRLVRHTEFVSSSANYLMVKGNKSPYDGDLVYWSSRMGRHPELPNRKAKLLKQQQGKCQECGLYFLQGDVMEVDHKEPLTLGGLDEWKNMQLLHRHCHHKKTATDGSQKSINDNRKAH